MAVIEISDSLFARLQKLAVPLVDTPVTVIERLLSSYEAQTGQTGATAGQSESREGRRVQSQGEFEPGKVPSLRHTRILAAEFAGRAADSWNNLVHVAHIEAVRRLGSAEAVRRISTTKMILGRASSERAKAGYRYLAEINACIQNVDAEHSWSNTFRLAKALKVSVEVEFEWLQKSEAAHPGKTARMQWKPKDEHTPTK
jgi:predicted transcriptional regulator